MKNILLPVLFISILFVSCYKSSNPVASLDSSFVFPLETGNEWSYTNSETYSDIKPDSIKYLLRDRSWSTKKSVTGEFLLDSVSAFELKEESEELGEGYSYYSNEDEGLMEIAYKSSGGALPKVSSGIKYLFNGKSYSSIEQIISHYTPMIMLVKISNDSLIYFNPPKKVYEYPMETGNEWVFSSNEIVRINKVIEKKEMVRTHSGSYECFKIKWKYDQWSDGTWDEDITIIEYLSSKGVVKMEMVFNDVTIATSYHPDGIGTADIKTERILTRINF